MGNRHHRMGKQHSGPGKTHDFPDFLPHDRFVAMYLTVGTEGFRLHKRTLVASHPGIGFQICTFGTKSAFGVVFFAAVQGNHFRYHPLFWILPIGIMLFLFWDKIPKKIQKILLITACVLFGAVYILRMLDTADSIVVFQPEKGAIFSLISQLFTKK